MNSRFDFANVTIQRVFSEVSATNVFFSVANFLTFARNFNDTTMQTIHAHYDGYSIQLEEPLDLKRNEKLLVTRYNEQQEFVTTTDIETASLNNVGQNDFLRKEEIFGTNVALVNQSNKITVYSSLITVIPILPKIRKKEFDDILISSNRVIIFTNTSIFNPNT